MSSEKQHSILGQRKLHQTDIVHARGHNNREEEVGNTIAAAPPPAIIYGPEDTWVGVRDRLRELEIKPRKGAVLALELMMTTSPEWWPQDDPVRYVKRLRRFIRRAMRYLLGRYERYAIVSITLHADEQTPHLHVVVLPIRRRIDARFADKGERWTLSARGNLPPKRAKDAPPIDYATYWRGGIGSRGQMAYEQTRFAEVMAPLGLTRGKVWSGAPNKPNSEWQAEMRATIAAAAKERDGLHLGRAHYDRELDRIVEDRARLNADREKLDAHRAEVDPALERARAEEARLAEQRRALDAERATFEEARVKLQAFKAQLIVERDRQAAERAMVLQDQDRLAERAPLVAALAEASVEAIRSIDLERVPQVDRDRVMRATHAVGLRLEAAAGAHWSIAAAQRDLRSSRASHVR